MECEEAGKSFISQLMRSHAITEMICTALRTIRDPVFSVVVLPDLLLSCQSPDLGAKGANTVGELF